MRRQGIYVASIFLSAFLLFLLQPILARMLLPVFGGSPAVWNTCMVFFQALLLAGYAYAHDSLRRLGVTRQRWLHAALLLLSLLFVLRVLPRSLSDSPALRAVGPDGRSPVLSILAALTTLAGIPFFVLSTNSSLTQRWFSLASLRGSAEPFRLYAASNAGSLAALLGYPLLVEPVLGLRAQLALWSGGYVLFVVLSLTTMFLARGTTARDEAAADAGVAHHTPITWRRRLRWVALAAVASSLLLSVTMQIATDIVSAPLFWVVPLAVYLVTFIVAFSPARRPPRQLVALLTTIGVALCFVIVMVPTVLPMWFALIALLGTLFTGALLCHGDLADDRPAAVSLTDFYLWLAVGGVVGGIANSIVAPAVFTSVAEFPLTLVCLAIVLHPPRRPDRSTLAIALAVFLAMAVAAAGVVAQRSGFAGAAGAVRWQLMPLPVLIAGVLLARRDGLFASVAALVAAFMIAGLHFVDPIVDQGRSFFGVSRVTENAESRMMVHGVTVHGAQRKDRAKRDIPVSYYYPDGPLGWVVSHAPPGADIGIVGLGAGALAPLAADGQRVTYFEIDPLVRDMALRDFTFLRDSRAVVGIEIGDGRRLLERAAEDRFDLLVIDAFSSDAIPMHLLTDEAIALYLRKLKPGGLLVMHISNRYADLARVFRGWRLAVPGRRVAIDQYVPPPQLEAEGVLATVAVAIGRSPSALAPLAATRQWYWLEDDGPAVRWTDDRASLVGVLNRNILRP